MILSTCIALYEYPRYYRVRYNYVFTILATFNILQFNFFVYFGTIIEELVWYAENEMLSYITYNKKLYHD